MLGSPWAHLSLHSISNGILLKNSRSLQRAWRTRGGSRKNALASCFLGVEHVSHESHCHAGGSREEGLRVRTMKIIFHLPLLPHDTTCRILSPVSPSGLSTSRQILAHHALTRNSSNLASSLAVAWTLNSSPLGCLSVGVSSCFPSLTSSKFFLVEISASDFLFLTLVLGSSCPF